MQKTLYYHDGKAVIVSRSEKDHYSLRLYSNRKDSTMSLSYEVMGSMTHVEKETKKTLQEYMQLVENSQNWDIGCLLDTINANYLQAKAEACNITQRQLLNEIVESYRMSKK